MSLTGYLYTLQVICTAQVTCLVHIYEPNRIFAHLYVICTVQITCLVRIYQRTVTCNFHVHKHTVSVLFSKQICTPNRLFVQYK